MLAKLPGKALFSLLFCLRLSSVWRKGMFFQFLSSSPVDMKRWRHAYNTHLLPYPPQRPISSKCLISAWAIIKEAIQYTSTRECFSWAVAAPPVLHSGQTLGWKACMLMTKVRKCPWGLRRITFSGPLAAKGEAPPRFREQVMNTVPVPQCRASAWLWGCWQSRQVRWWICVLHLGQSRNPSACQVLFSAGLVLILMGISSDLVIQVYCKKIYIYI